jgi:hypothetical protein
VRRRGRCSPGAPGTVDSEWAQMMSLEQGTATGRTTATRPWFHFAPASHRSQVHVALFRLANLLAKSDKQKAAEAYKRVAADPKSKYKGDASKALAQLK